jgi:two-component sensor histidine kinase
MRRISILLPLCFTLCATAQSPQEAQVLLQRLHASTSDIGRVSLMQALSRYYVDKVGEEKADLDSADQMNDTAAAVSRKLDFKPGIGRSLYLGGLIRWERGNQERADTLFAQALAYGGRNDLYELEADVYAVYAQHTNTDRDNIERKYDYAQKALDMYHRAKDRRREADLLEYEGDIEQLRDQFDNAIRLIQASLDIYRAIGYQGVQENYELLCDIYRQKGDFGRALANALLAIKAAETVGETGGAMISLYNRVALLYLDLKNNKEALEYFGKARSKAIARNDTARIFQVSINMSDALFRLDSNQEALDLLKNTERDFLPGSEEFRMHMADALLRGYLKVGKTKEARPYYDQIRGILAHSKPEDRGRIFTLRDVANYLLAVGEYREAVPYIDSLNQSIGNIANVLIRSQIELNYFKADSGMGKLRDAIAHYEAYKRLNDTLFNTDKARELSTLEVQFETEQKDKDIELLRQHGLLVDADLRRTREMRNIIIGGSVILLVLLGLLYNRYRLKKRSNLQLQRKQEEINGQYELVKRLAREKDWLLKEIHHRVKNNLHIITSLLESQSSFAEDAVQEAIRDSQHRVHAMSLIHQKLYQGEGGATIEFGLYVRELVSYLRGSFGMHSIVQVNVEADEMAVGAAQAVHLALILNETITNAFKYAFPGGRKGVIMISAHRRPDDYLLLVVRDNGVGLPADFDIGRSGSLGMKLIKGLSDNHHGELNITTENGTTVSLSCKIDPV